MNSKSILTATLLLVLPASAATGQDTKVDWDFYMRSPAAISAVGSAVALATPCEKGIIFQETISATERSIAIHCPGDSGYDFSVVVQFDIFGDQVIPRRFDLAG